MKQLLIVDPDANNRVLLNHLMTREGFKITKASNGEYALNIMREQQIDLVILDIEVIEYQWLQVSEYIRNNYDIPMIVVSGSHQLEQKESAFISGVDDYITKPYDPTELLYRIKALFRRYSIVSSDKIRVHSLVINRQNYEITDGESMIILPLKEFELFAQLAQYPGRLFTREELIRLIWGIDYAGDERTVDVHIRRIRKKFAYYKDAFDIRTIRGAGYKFEVYNK